MTHQQSTTSTKTKKCNACLQVFPVDNFYILKTNNNNNPNIYRIPYCKPCEIQKVKKYQKENPEKFRASKNKYSNKYYHNNKQKRIIIYKRYYYNKLSPKKQEIYKLKVQKKYPNIFHLIFDN